MIFDYKIFGHGMCDRLHRAHIHILPERMAAVLISIWDAWVHKHMFAFFDYITLTYRLNTFPFRKNGENQRKMASIALEDSECIDTKYLQNWNGVHIDRHLHGFDDWCFLYGYTNCLQFLRLNLFPANLFWSFQWGWHISLSNLEYDYYVYYYHILLSG